MATNNKVKHLSIRFAQKTDTKDIWKIRNHPSIRKNSADTKKISLSHHQKWFGSYLEQKQGYFYVLIETTNQCKLVGYCRYDKKSSSLSVSIAIADQYRKKGYGNYLLKNTIRKLPGTEVKLAAKIKKSNLVSVRLFEKCGFKINKKGNKYLYLEKSR